MTFDIEKIGEDQFRVTRDGEAIHSNPVSELAAGWMYGDLSREPEMYASQSEFDWGQLYETAVRVMNRFDTRISMQATSLIIAMDLLKAERTLN